MGAERCSCVDGVPDGLASEVRERDCGVPIGGLGARGKCSSPVQEVELSCDATRDCVISSRDLSDTKRLFLPHHPPRELPSQTASKMT